MAIVPSARFVRTLIQEVSDINIALSQKSWNSLRIIPIHSGWTEERPCGIMVVATIRLNSAGERGSEPDVSRSYPVQNRAFHTLGVIRPRAGDTFLDLE
jgi:hypothetical protein